MLACRAAGCTKQPRDMWSERLKKWEGRGGRKHAADDDAAAAAAYDMKKDLNEGKGTELSLHLSPAASTDSDLPPFSTQTILLA